MGHARNEIDDRRLAQLLTDLHDTTEVDITFGGATSPNSSSLAITHTHGARTQELRDLAIHSGLGLGGKALSLRCPVWVRDYPRAQGITHDYDRTVHAEQLRAIFAIPLIIAEEVRAVVYGALRQDVPIGDRTLIAADLAIRQCVGAPAREAEMARVSTHATSVQSKPDSGTTAQGLQAAHDELVAIADGVTDPALRKRLNDVCDRMRERLDANTTSQSPTVQLSPRELAVLAQVAEGCKNAEIAERLAIVPNTVRAYLESAMRKLGTHNRIQTVNAARSAGLLP